MDPRHPGEHSFGSPDRSRPRKRPRRSSYSPTSPLGGNTALNRIGLERVNTFTLDPDHEYEEVLPPGSIRILTLHPGPENSHLDCSLEIRTSDTRDLNDSRYEALSYVWGDELATCVIRVRRLDGFRRLWITPNLEAALLQLRHESNPRRFWIDAICINQNSDTEKNLQVPMMSQIYSQASNVCVWIGTADEYGPRALALMGKIRFLKDYDNVVESETRCRDWIAPTKFMGQTWFSRRWVVQEIALARSATLHCGKYKIPWTHFAEAVTLFEEMAPRVRTKFRESKHHYQHPDFVGQVSAFSATKLVRITNELIRKSEDGTILIKQMSLESLISRLTSFDASRAHDVIYAILCLAKDIPGSEPFISTIVPPTVGMSPEGSYAHGPEGEELNPEDRRRAMKVAERMRVHKYPVDYGKSFFDVCKDFLRFSWEKESPSLDILFRPWAPTGGQEEMPSWIRSLKNVPYGRRPDGHWARKNADPLVGEPGRNSYSASGKYPCDWQFGDDPNSRSLWVSGFVLDIVDLVEDTARSGVIPQTWPTVCGWEDTNENPPEIFWRTIIADRDSNGQKASQLYQLSCRETFDQRVEDADVDTKQIRDQVQNSHLKNFAERLGAVIWNRRLTKTRNYHLTGLTPYETHTGDLIAILPGCSVPVVLRPTSRLANPYPAKIERRKKMEQKPPTVIYTLIGECFLYGMMDGEAFAKKNDENKPYEWFEIQ